MSTRRNIGPIVSFVVRTTTVSLLLAIAIAIAVWLTVTRTVPPSSARPDLVWSVEVVDVSPQRVARTWRGYGSAEALDSADVPSEVSSIVIEIPKSIEVGRSIVAGALIVELDAVDFERQQEIADRSLRELSTRKEQLDLDQKTALEQVRLSEQDVAILKNELARVEDARASGAANPREVDLVRLRLIKAESSLMSAHERRDAIPLSRQLLDTQEAAERASRDLAKRNVERCRITSPIDGIIESFDVEIGERVDPMRRVARIVDPTRIVVPVRLPSSARVSVAVGNDVTLRTDGAISRVWQGEVSRISPVDDGTTRTMIVFVEPNKLGEPESSPIAPGTFISALVESASKVPRIVVPRSSVRNERIWYVDADGKIASTKVEVAFPLESLDGLERRLVLRTLLPEGVLVVIDANRAPPMGTDVTPVLCSDRTTTASGRMP